MLSSFTFGIDEGIIEVHYHKNVELLYQDLIDIALERSRYIGQSKKHHLVFEMAIAGPEGCFPFIAFSDPHLIVDISQIKLGET